MPRGKNAMPDFDSGDSEVDNPSTSNLSPMTQTDLYQAAKYIREELQKVRNIMPEPSSAEKLTYDHTQVPK